MAPESIIGVDERELDDAALEALAEAYETPPPPGLRERVVLGARQDAELRRTKAVVTRTRMVGALAAGIALAFVGLLARELQLGREQARDIAALKGQNEQLTEQVAAVAGKSIQLAAQLDEQRRALAGVSEALDAQGSTLRLVTGPRLLTASLAPQKGVTGAGRVMVDAITGETAVVLSGMAPAAAGKTYELWAIRGKKAPEPAGLIAVSAGAGSVMHMPQVPRPTEVTAFAISIEPSAGSTSPTGPIVLVGAVAS